MILRFPVFFRVLALAVALAFFFLGLVAGFGFGALPGFAFGMVTSPKWLEGEHSKSLDFVHSRDAKRLRNGCDKLVVHCVRGYFCEMPAQNYHRLGQENVGAEPK